MRGVGLTPCPYQAAVVGLGRGWSHVEKVKQVLSEVFALCRS